MSSGTSGWRGATEVKGRTHHGRWGEGHDLSPEVAIESVR